MQLTLLGLARRLAQRTAALAARTWLALRFWWQLGYGWHLAWIKAERK
jgi:hypothetical protein